MAWTEYAAVRSSTVYENKGIAKPLLLMVTWLIEHAEEGKQPGEHEGYCYASVKYLAESLGCSESAVEKWIDRFVADGWVSKETSRDKNGHQHNRYCLAPGALGRLAALKRVRGEERPKNTNKSRPSRSERVGGKFASGSPAGTTRASRVNDGCQPARSGMANRNGAGQPARSERNPDPLGAGECVDDMFLDEFCDELKQNASHSNKPASQDHFVETQGDPVNPSRDSVPNPAEGASRPRTPRQLIPVNSAARPLTPSSAAPRKPVCGFCGGPLKRNKGVCLKCGVEPLGRPDQPQPKKLKNEYGEEVEGLPHHFLSRDHEATCQNPGCDITRRESLYDPSSQYCCGEQGRGAAV